MKAYVKLKIEGSLVESGRD